MKDDGSQVYVWRNTATLAGLALVAVSLFLIVTLSFYDLFTPTPNPYLGIFTFLVLPILIALGTAVAVGGFVYRRQWLRRELGGLSALQYYPRIDFNDPLHQRVLAYVFGGAIVVFGFFGIMSYEGYQYTESNDFCGRVCHTVMNPEYTAHQFSPHARVNCVDCHIGEGATHYVRAKLSGVRQVIALITDDYARPIPSALTRLRPSAETCEQCHSPRYFGEQLVTRWRFASDETSTPRPVRLILDIGGHDPAIGPVHGIHAHMRSDREIEYISLDSSMREIPWVRVIDKLTDSVHVYRSDGLSAEAPPPQGVRRTMDCLDCHNRAMHTYTSPSDSGDTLLHRDPELRELVFAKRELVHALTEQYPTHDDGEAGVRAALERFYRDEPKTPEAIDSTKLESLVHAAGQIYRRTVFPTMNVDWRTYPSNASHFQAPGCFRCHAGNHVDESGEAIDSDCTSCHDFVVPNAEAGGVMRSEEWTHPVELEGIHSDLPCSDCHTGGRMAEATCEGCHADAVEFMAGTHPDFETFEIEADAMDGLAECVECHDLSEHMTSKQLNIACLECHEGEDYAAPGIITKQRREVAALLSAVPTDDPEARLLLERLKQAGPLHNLEASRKILRALSGH